MKAKTRIILIILCLLTGILFISFTGFMNVLLQNSALNELNRNNFKPFINQDLADLVNVYTPAALLISEADRDLYQILSAEQQIINSSPHSSEYERSLNFYYENMKQSSERIDKAFSLLPADKIKKFRIEYEQYREEWETLCFRVISLTVDEKGRQEAKKLSLGEGQEKFEKMRLVVDNFAAFLEKQAQIFKSRSREFEIIVQNKVDADNEKQKYIIYAFLLIATLILIFAVVFIRMLRRQITEITREKLEMQQKMLHTERLKSLGLLAGGIAHDFNNMLAGIMGAAELAKVSENPSDILNNLNIIIQATERAAELARKLLIFGRKSERKFAVTDINNILKTAVAILKHTADKKVDISVSCQEKPALILGDEMQLQNVFLNLGINGLHAMPNGGSLSFSTRTVYLEDLYCKESPFDIASGSYIEVEVRDTGCGIKYEDRNKIFEPFFTTREQGKGTGLGLSLVYGIVESHKGAVTLYSEMKEGTVFHVYFPVSSGEMPVEEEKEQVISGKGTILIVDDEDIVRVTARKMLEKMNYMVIEARNGLEAVAIFKENASHIDLVILDMVMPIMGGQETFFQLKQINKEIKVILSSGFAREGSIQILKNSGLSGFIQKPYRKSELSRIVADVLKITR